MSPRHGVEGVVPVALAPRLTRVLPCVLDPVCTLPSESDWWVLGPREERTPVKGVEERRVPQGDVLRVWGPPQR